MFWLQNKKCSKTGPIRDGKEPSLLGLVMFGFYDYQGSVQFGFLLSI